MHDDQAVVSRDGLDDPVTLGQVVICFEPSLGCSSEREVEVFVISDGSLEIQHDVVDGAGAPLLS